MRLHDAVEYFGLSVAVVFLVIEGIYNSKEREAVAKGENYLLVTGHLVKRNLSSLATFSFVAEGVWRRKTQIDYNSSRLGESHTESFACIPQETSSLLALKRQPRS